MRRPRRTSADVPLPPPFPPHAYLHDGITLRGVVKVLLTEFQRAVERVDGGLLHLVAGVAGDELQKKGKCCSLRRKRDAGGMRTRGEAQLT